MMPIVIRAVTPEVTRWRKLFLEFLREFYYRDLDALRTVIDRQWTEHKALREGRDDLSARVSAQGQTHQELS
jgi:hypothetical protein